VTCIIGLVEESTKHLRKTRTAVEENNITNVMSWRKCEHKRGMEREDVVAYSPEEGILRA
jgi:hypothetical protein